MRKMKDSGIEWIGKIPNDWKTLKVKYLATEPDSLFTDGDWINSDIITEEGVRYLTSGNVGEGYFKKQGDGYISQETFDQLHCLKALPNDLMICRLNLPIGRSCIIPNDEPFYVVAVDNVILRPNHDIDKKFIMYCMNTPGYAAEAEMAAGGTTMKRISRTDLGNLVVPIPSLEEQKAIADYLDGKCADIDQIRADIEKQIDILNDYKKSVITEAVTKGLNPKAKLKDSGIEWIGKIPEGWTIVPINYLTTSRSGGTPDRNKSQYWEEGTIPWMASGEVNKFLVYDTKEKITELATRLSNAKIVPANSVMVALNGQGKTKGMSAVLKIDAACNQSLCAFQCDPMRLNYMYLLYCFQSMYKFLRFQAGDDVRDGLAASFVKKQRIPLPSLNEQNEIASFIDEKCSEIDATIADKQKQLETLDEYKKSLIFEYVTGKKEVP